MPVPAAEASNYFVRLFSIVGVSLAQLVRTPTHSRRAEAGRYWARRSLGLTVMAAGLILALILVLDAYEIMLMPPRGTAWLWPARWEWRC